MRSTHPLSNATTRTSATSRSSSAVAAIGVSLRRPAMSPRNFGIRSAMPMREARRRCPDLLVVPPRMSHYQEVSQQVFAIFREFSPLVEGLSLDEAFLDVSASRSLFGDSTEIARRIKQRILDQTALTASVGVAPNKLVAKIASDLDKPDGLVVVNSDNVRQTLDPLPVEVIPGIGRVTLEKLHRVSIRSIRDLRTADDADLNRIFGRFAARMVDRASGVDDREVVSHREEKSISAEETFENDLTDRKAMNRKTARADRTHNRSSAQQITRLRHRTDQNTRRRLHHVHATTVPATAIERDRSNLRGGAGIARRLARRTPRRQRQAPRCGRQRSGRGPAAGSVRRPPNGREKSLGSNG